MKRKKFHTATDREILEGRTTDVYFARTLDILERERMSRNVLAEFAVKGFPDKFPWGIAAGQEEFLNLLEGRKVDVWGVPEGTPVRGGEPVMMIEGNYADFGELETALLGFLCQASGVATKAARLRMAAGDRSLLSFGARRMHPAVSPMIERSAFIGGCDGVATVKASEILGLEPSGTIPHALVLLAGGIDEAVLAFDRRIDKRVKRIALVDTFGDEKFEALAACQALGRKLYGVRLDTPGSRRGNMREIVEEVRWEMDLRGYKWVKIFVSGGVDERDIIELRDVVDGFGVGTCLSNAPVLDFAMDIVEVEGRPRSKRGKAAGAKKLLRCASCRRDFVVPRSRRGPRKCPCGGSLKPLLAALMKSGRRVKAGPGETRIRKKVLADLKWLGACAADDETRR
jgi:nicotinate phosphoribosyltransferase